MRLRRQSPWLALVLLTAVAIIGFVDRILMNVLIEPLKLEFGLSDTDVGLLTGLAFAVVNVALGLVVARIAERRRRLTLIAVGTGLWSIATAACGAVSSFAQLALARIGVGVGEAIGLPASQSVVADYFPPERRGMAMSVLMLAPALGAFIGAAGGALVASQYGWRMAFVAAAVPGLILAVLVALLVAEPPRGQFDGGASDEVPPMGAVIGRFFGEPVLRQFLAGSTIASFAGFGLNAFTASMLIRRFDFTLVEAGLSAGLIASLPSSLSVIGGGWLADKLAPRDRRAYALIPAVALLLAAPLYVFAITRETPGIVIPLLCLTALFQYCYLGCTYAVFANRMEPRMRATSSAFTSMIYSLVGGGLGPLLVGQLSDRLGVGSTAAGGGLPAAMAITSCFYLWASLHYFAAARAVSGEETAARTN